MLLSYLVSSISFPTGTYPTLWLPGGLLLGVLLLAPPRDWPLYLISALPGNALYSYLFYQPPGLAIIIYLSNCIEAILGAWIIRRMSNLLFPSNGNGEARSGNLAFHYGFSQTSSVLLVVFSALLSTGASSAIQSILLTSLLPGISFWSALRFGVIGHSLGILVMTPLILAWVGYRPRRSFFTNPDRLIELIGLFTAQIAWSYYVFTNDLVFLGQGYLVMPFMVWAALRFGPRGVTSGGLVVSISAAWGMNMQLHGFNSSLELVIPRMDTLGMFLGINLITCFILTAVWEEGKLASAELRSSEKRYRRLIENQGEGIGIVNLNEEFTFANPSGNQIFGVYPSSLVGHNLREFTRPQQFDQILKQTELRQNNQKSSYEIEIIQPCGEKRQLLVTATPEYDSQGKINGSFAIFRDITDRKMAEMAMRDSQSRYQTLFDHSPIPIWEEDFSDIKRMFDELRKQGVEDLRQYLETHPDVLDTCKRMIKVLDVNQATLMYFGFEDKQEFLAQIKYIMMRRGPNDLILEEMTAIGNHATEFEGEGPNDVVDGVIRYHHVRWSLAPGHEQDYSRVIVTIIDITERKNTEETLRYLSTHDVLTGLYNRNFFEAEMERLQQSRLFPVNIMVVDVNGMKATNDTYGHAAGDELLKRTAQVLKQVFRKEDIIARMGGDEFVVLFSGAISEQDALRRVRECLNDHNLWNNGSPLSLAVGVASGQKGTPLHEVLKKADQLMYREKNRYHKAKGEAKG